MKYFVDTKWDGLYKTDGTTWWQFDEYKLHEWVECDYKIKHVKGYTIHTPKAPTPKRIASFKMITEHELFLRLC